MTGALLAALAGASFGALTVAVRWALRRGGEPDAGALAVVLIGTVATAVAAAPLAVRDGVDVHELWPFFGAGLLAPGASQLVLTFAVRHAGPSRAAILMGTAPLISIAIALTLLGEPFHLPLVLGALLIVLGGGVLASERKPPKHFQPRGAVLALLAAVLFATRDNILRWAARDTHPPPLAAATTSLLAGAALVLVYTAIMRRGGLWAQLPQATRVFAPAGIALALGYAALLAAVDRGRVSIISPLNATGSLWAVLLTALVIGRSDPIGRRTIVAGILIVSGGALIGALR